MRIMLSRQLRLLVIVLAHFGTSSLAFADNLSFTPNCSNVWQDCCNCGTNLQINWNRPCSPGVCPAAPSKLDAVSVLQDCIVGASPFADANADTLSQSGGTFSILGILNVRTGATFDGPVVWQSGTLARADADVPVLTVNNGMTLSGAGDKLLGANVGRPMGHITLSNAATITWQDTGNLVVGVGPGGLPSLLRVEAGSIFDQQTDASLLTTQQFGFGKVTNLGTIRKSAGAGTSNWNIDLENNGLFDIQSGNVTLTGLGSANGEFRIDAGSTLTLATSFGFEFRQGIQFTGDGEAVLVDTGSSAGVIVNESVELNRLRVADSGEIRSTNNMGQLQITGRLEVDGARITPPVTVKPGARIEQSGPHESSFGDLFIEGEAEISQGILSTVDHTITIQFGGVVEIHDGAALRTAGLVNLPIQNNGKIQKTMGNGTASVKADFFELFFNNTGGLIHVASGTLDFEDSNIRNEGGEWQIDSGTTVKAPGSFGGMFELNAGAVRGGGTLLVRRLNNNGGLVAPGDSAGILNVIGDGPTGRPGDYLQGANGTLEIEIGGLTPGTGHDQLKIAGNATLDGKLKLSLLNGFIPATNDEATILTALTRSGTFAAVDTGGLPDGLEVEMEYSATSVLVRFINNIPVNNNNNNSNSNGNGNSNSNANSNNNDNANSNDNTNTNGNANNNNNNNDNTDGPSPNPTPDCGNGACGAGGASMMPLLIAGLTSILRRRWARGEIRPR